MPGLAVVRGEDMRGGQIGITGGVMFGDNGNIYSYLGGGIVSPGLSVSLTHPKNPCDNPVPGWTVAGQLGAGLVGQVGHSYGNGSNFSEWGIGTPGFAATGYYVFGPIHLP